MSDAASSPQAIRPDLYDLMVLLVDVAGPHLTTEARMYALLLLPELFAQSTSIEQARGEIARTGVAPDLTAMGVPVGNRWQLGLTVRQGGQLHGLDVASTLLNVLLTHDGRLTPRARQLESGLRAARDERASEHIGKRWLVKANLDAWKRACALDVTARDPEHEQRTKRVEAYVRSSLGRVLAAHAHGPGQA